MANKLALFGRPYVVFDPSNKDHRRWFSEFNKRRTWGHCPVRFIVNEDHGDLLTMIQRSLIQFYVDKEFGTDNNLKIRSSFLVKKSLPKGKKTVDTQIN